MNITKKLFYEQPYTSSCIAEITEVENNKLIFNESIAFPEGGGQEGDRGVIHILNPDGAVSYSLEFTDTQKGYGRVLFLKDFPVISADTPTYHIIDEPLPVDKLVGKKAVISINVARRLKLSVNHSAIHLALLYLGKIRKDIGKLIKGCLIDEEHARLDFSTPDKFTQEELFLVEKHITDAIQGNLEFIVYPHELEKEALFWKCEDFTIPCGGTHVPSAGYLRAVDIRGKRKSKMLQRLVVNAVPNDSGYSLYKE